MSENNTSTVLDYERSAMQNAPMPPGLTFPDQLMYQSLALLYARYRLKLISREQASVEKKQLLREHEAFSYRWSLGDHYAEVIKRTEAARTAYRKDRTLENADKLLAAIDGVR